MVTGSMFLATAAGLVSQGHITGSGPTNPQLRNQLKKAGWKPYSIRIPDANSPGGYRYFELARFELYSTYFTVLADFMEAQHAGARGDATEFYSKLVGSITSNLTSRKYLTGLIDTMDLIGGMAYEILIRWKNSPTIWPEVVSRRYPKPCGKCKIRCIETPGLL